MQSIRRSLLLVAILGLYAPVALSSKLCSAHSQCSHLAGDCCPTTDGVFLDCCNKADEIQLTGQCCHTPTRHDDGHLYCCSPETSTCASNPWCAHEGLVGACCPNPFGEYLPCCQAACRNYPRCVALGMKDSHACCPPAPGQPDLDCCRE